MRTQDETDKMLAEIRKTLTIPQWCLLVDAHCSGGSARVQGWEQRPAKRLQALNYGVYEKPTFTLTERGRAIFEA